MLILTLWSIKVKKNEKFGFHSEEKLFHCNFYQIISNQFKSKVCNLCVYLMEEYRNRHRNKQTAIIIFERL